jgi:hypothetical protein
MNLNDLKNASKNTDRETLSSLNQRAGSNEFVQQANKELKRIRHPVDFTSASNFARYGSAEKYYTDAIGNIYSTYPYDGSKKEQQEWRNNASDLELYFVDNVYPKTAGYITLGSSSFENYTTGTVAISRVFKTTPYPQYIKFYGGPNAADTFEKSNIYDPGNKRESNLKLDGVDGNTVEFWFKRESNTVTNYALFDIWNGMNSGSSEYGRFLVEATGSKFNVTYKSGSYGADGTVFSASSGYDITQWHHYAFTVKNNNSKLQIYFFLDGQLVSSQQIASQAVSASNQSALTGTIGAYQYVRPLSSITFNPSTGSVYGSFDEFRFWKTARTEQEIRENLYSHVGGGTNTDDENVYLGTYFKFNEGILSTSQDAACLDYSGRLSNGLISNYTSDIRSTGSAMEAFNSDIVEQKDLIVYSTHPAVAALETGYTLSGSVYDAENANSLVNTIPSWILEQEDREGTNEVKNLVQILSSYFDFLHIQMEYLNKIKYTEFLEGNFQVYPFYDRLLSSNGFKVFDLFNSAAANEIFLNKNNQLNFEEKLQNIKNEIYRNIYNNLVFLYKTKGTEKSFRNLLRCFGIDEELVKINIYSNNETLYFKDNFTLLSKRKNSINFNSSETTQAATIFQKAVFNLGAEEKGYISGSQTFADFHLIPNTVEAQFVFPQKASKESKNYISNNFVTASLFGAHSAKEDQTDLTWDTGDKFNFQVYATKTDPESKDVYFVLSSSAGSLSSNGIILSSQLFRNAYSNQKWNFAVRIKNEKNKLVNFIDETDNEPYDLEFYGVNTEFGTILQEFSASTKISNSFAKDALRKNKRVYVGAHRQNFSGSLLQYSDVKVNYLRYWFNYLDNDTIKEHSKNVFSVGVRDLNNNSYFGIKSLKDLQIPNYQTIALNWDFQLVTGSNNLGQLEIYDVSSGDTSEKYGIISNTSGKKHSGFGYGFSANSSDFIFNDYSTDTSKKLPETLVDLEMIKLVDEDRVKTERDTNPSSYHISFEKSMYQTVSEEMLKLFSSVEDLNTIIGHPINKKREEYKDLKFVGRNFFDKISNTPNLEKYLEFYKWVDSSVNRALTQFIPVGANYTNNLSNVIESHILERNKVTINQPLGLVTQQPEAEILASNTYPIVNITETYTEYKAPASPAGSGWYKKRAIRSDAAVTSNNPVVDSVREQIRKAAYYNNFHKTPTFYDLATNTTFAGEVDRIRIFSGLVKISDDTIDFQKANRFNLIKDLIGSGKTFNVALTNAIVGYGVEQPALSKQEVYLANLFELNQAGFTPFKTYKDTVTGEIRITNNLNDSYGSTEEISMQGPFTDTHVGGNKHRHNAVSSSGNERIELYSTDGVTFVSNESNRPSSKIYREERVKRPVNIKNIRNNTGTQVLGNFSKGYEVLGINTREIANINFVISGGAEPVAVTSSIPLFVENQLSERVKSDTVISSKFSTPGAETSGRGALDNASEEYSVYNSINNRNQKVRKYLDKWSAATASYNTNYPSFHKIYKNPVERLALNGTSSSETIQTTSYDNLFVQYQIPRTDKQYAWITASISGGITAFGYINGGLVPNLDFSSNYVFLSGSTSSLGFIDFAGTSISLTKSVNTSSNLVSLSASDSPYLNEYLNNMNGAYGSPSWKQIRAGETNPLARIGRKNNLITVDNSDRLATKNSISSFYEPPVQYNLPTNHEIYLQNKQSLISVTTELANETSSFANENLLEALSGNINYKIPEEHESYTRLYKNNFTSGPDSKPANWSYRLKNLKIRSKLFPKHKFSALSKIRSRNKYAETFGTGSNGYDRNPGTIKTFWRSDLANRARTTAYDTGKFSTTGSGVTIKLGAVNSLNYPQINYPGQNFQYSASALNTKTYGTHIISQSYNNTSSVNAFESANRNYSSTQAGGFSTIYQSASIFGDLAPYSEAELRQLILQPSGTYAGVLKYSPVSEQKKSVNTFVYNNNFPRVFPRPQFLYINSLFKFGGQWTWINGGMHYRTPELSGKTPWFDSYEEFFTDIKPVTTDMGFIPEYRIENFLDYYLKTTKGDFFHPITSSYLEIIGSEEKFENLTSSINISNNLDSKMLLGDFELKTPNRETYLNIKIDAIKKLLPYNGFYPQQRVLQIVNNFYDSWINLSADKIFNYKSSADDSVKITVHNTTSNGIGSPLDSQIVSLIQPLFSPGILFNTIKSGLAVDWPCFITSSALYSSSVAPSFLYAPSSSDPSNINSYEYARSGIDGWMSIISSSYNYRFPFESLIEFDTIIAQNNLQSSGSNLYYLHPSYYSSTAVSGNDRQNIRYPSYDLKEAYNDYNRRSMFKNEKYRLSMHNFLAEIPSFFLKDGGLRGFKSLPQRNFGVAISGTVYSMDLVMKKDRDFSFFATPEPISTDAFNPRHYLNYFGPPTRHVRTNQNNPYAIYGGASIAYAPHSPPYYFGEETMRLSFTASDTRQYTLREILDNLNEEHLNKESEEAFLFWNHRDITDYDYKNNPAYVSRMKLNSCLNYKQVASLRPVTFDSAGNPNTIQSESDDFNVWSIQTKMETPVINFNTPLNNNIVRDYNTVSAYDPSTWIITGSGIWFGYGEVPETGKGLTFSIKESNARQTNTNIGSLISLCGFKSDQQEIGVLSQKKLVKESIVMIPYVNKRILSGSSDEAYTIADEILGENGLYESAGRGTKKYPYFFAIDPKVVERLVGLKFTGTQGINITADQVFKKIQNDSTVLNNSITNTIYKMSEYVIPPHLNWMLDRKIQPFVMYFFEFTSEMEQEDLSDIWQGLMPRIAREAEKESVTLTHKMGEDEFFHGKVLPSDIQWKIFKVKKKAKQNYYELTGDNKDDQKFKFQFSDEQKAVSPNYSYNWPYDFFSLVEAAKADLTFEVKDKELDNRIIPLFSSSAGPLQKSEEQIKIEKENIEYSEIVNQMGKKQKAKLFSYAKYPSANKTKNAQYNVINDGIVYLSVKDGEKIKKGQLLYEYYIPKNPFADPNSILIQGTDTVLLKIKAKFDGIINFERESWKTTSKQIRLDSKNEIIPAGLSSVVIRSGDLLHTVETDPMPQANTVLRVNPLLNAARLFQSNQQQFQPSISATTPLISTTALNNPNETEDFV